MKIITLIIIGIILLVGVVTAGITSISISDESFTTKVYELSTKEICEYEETLKLSSLRTYCDSKTEEKIELTEEQANYFTKDEKAGLVKFSYPVNKIEKKNDTSIITNPK